MSSLVVVQNWTRGLVLTGEKVEIILDEYLLEMYEFKSERKKKKKAIISCTVNFILPNCRLLKKVSIIVEFYGKIVAIKNK